MPPEPQPTPFDRIVRRQRRDRAARSDKDTLYLHRRSSEELLDRLALVKRHFKSALLLGCSDRWILEQLKSKGIGVIAADPGALFARSAGGIQCDEDFLPFADSSFDLVIAIGTLDTVNDLPGALTLIRRSLRPDGLLLAALAGAGGLPRLRNALRAAEEAEATDASPRIHPQIDVRAAGDLLMRAGFALPVVDSDTVTVRFRGLDQLLADLRGMAATNLLATRARRAFGRLAFAAAAADFQMNSEPDGKTAERFDILYLSGWAPSPEQPKPAQRGSATHSLAEALRNKVKASGRESG